MRCEGKGVVQVLAALKRRGEFAKPWLAWTVGVMYYMLLELRRYEAADAEGAEWLLDHSAGVRCGRDPYFAKLMEKLIRLHTHLRVRPPPPQRTRPHLARWPPGPQLCRHSCVCGVLWGHMHIQRGQRLDRAATLTRGSSHACLQCSWALA